MRAFATFVALSLAGCAGTTAAMPPQRIAIDHMIISAAADVAAARLPLTPASTTVARPIACWGSIAAARLRLSCTTSCATASG